MNSQAAPVRVPEPRERGLGAGASSARFASGRTVTLVLHVFRKRSRVCSAQHCAPGWCRQGPTGADKVAALARALQPLWALPGYICSHRPPSHTSEDSRPAAQAGIRASVASSCLKPPRLTPVHLQSWRKCPVQIKIIKIVGSTHPLHCSPTHRKLRTSFQCMASLCPIPLQTVCKTLHNNNLLGNGH